MYHTIDTKNTLIEQPDFFGLGGTITNIEGHEKYFTDQRKKLPDIRNNLLEMIAEGDKVIAISLVSGTDVGGYLSPEPTNKKCDCKVIVVYSLKEGKIAKGEILSDALTAYQLLGLLPPTEEIGK